jgi:hypothetical protein
MTKASLNALSAQQLVERFAEIALKQDVLVMRNESGKRFNDLFAEMTDVTE